MYQGVVGGKAVARGENSASPSFPGQGHENALIRKFHHIPDAKLVHDVVPMHFDRSLGSRQDAGDVVVAVPLQNKAEHSLLHRR